MSKIIHRVAQAARVLVGKGVTGSWLSIGTGGGTYSPVEGAQSIGKSAILAICIGAWGLEYPQVRMVVHDRKGQPQYDHPFMEILSRPNDYMDESEFYTIKALYSVWTGTPYIHKLRGQAGQLVGLDMRSAVEITEELSATTGELIGYIFTNHHGEREPVALTDIVAMPWFVRDPANVRLGLSPMMSCFTERRTYDIVNDFVYQFLRNGAVPGTAIVAKDGLEGTEDDKEKFKERLFRKFGLSNGGVGGTILLEGDFDIKRMSANLQELALDGLRTTPEANICATFRVPVELVGVQTGLQNSSYNNKKEARRGFVENTLMPMWASDASRLTRILREEYKNTMGWFVQPDLSQVAALREDEDKRLERALKGFEKNLFYRDQALAIAGYPPEDKAKVYSVDLIKPTTPIGKASQDKAHVKSVEDLDALWKSLDDDRMKHVKALSKALAKGVEILKASVINSAKSAVGAKQDPKPPTDAELKRIFLEGTEEERTNMASEMMRRAAKDADFDPDEIKSWLEGTVDESVAASADKITKSYGTMRDEIVEVVKANAGKTKEEIAAALNDYFEILGNRIATIAQTTATNATTVAQQGAWKRINDRRGDKKIIKQMWLSMRDGKVRTDHAARDGETFEIGEELDGTLGPGLSGVAGDDINCRCVLTPITETKG